MNDINYIEFEKHLLTLKRSENTVKTYLFVVRGLLEFAGKFSEDIHHDDLIKFQQHLALDKLYSKNSLYTAVEAMNAFFSFIDSNAAEGLTRPKRPGTTPRFISQDEVKRLLDAALRSGDARDHLVVSILAYSGVRVSELCCLLVADLDASNRTLLIRAGKGDKDRIVMLPEDLVDTIFEHVRSQSSEFIFSGGKDHHISVRTIQRIVSKYADKAGIEKTVTPHVLRHTFATTILRRGGDIRFIQQLLGHRSVATTQIYTHVDDTMIRNMYDKFGPEY